MSQIKQNNLKLKKLNTLTTPDYNLFLGRTAFKSNDEYKNIFVYQPTLDKLELKKIQRCWLRS